MNNNIVYFKNSDIELNKDTENNIKILIDQCDKAMNYDIKILVKLLEVNGNDIANSIFDIEDNNVEKRLKSYEEDTDWDNLLIQSNFDQKIIRKLLDIKKFYYFLIDFRQPIRVVNWCSGNIFLVLFHLTN